MENILCDAHVLYLHVHVCLPCDMTLQALSCVVFHTVRLWWIVLMNVFIYVNMLLFQSLNYWYSWLTQSHRTSSPRSKSPKMFFQGKYTMTDFSSNNVCNSACLFSLSCAVVPRSNWRFRVEILYLHSGRDCLPWEQRQQKHHWLLFLTLFPQFQGHHHHRCGAWRLWRRLSDGCSSYNSDQPQTRNICFHLLGEQPDIRYTSTFWSIHGPGITTVVINCSLNKIMDCFFAVEVMLNRSFAQQTFWLVKHRCNS